VQALFHAAGVALRALVLATGQAHELEQLADPRLLLARGDAVQLGEVAQVVVAGEPLVDPALAAEDVALPPVGISRVISILIVVVLPAPFGPSSPNSSPSPTEKSIPRTASMLFDRRRNEPVVVR
jgi:hypothetical protein